MRNRFKPPRSTTERAAQAKQRNQAYQKEGVQRHKEYKRLYKEYGRTLQEQPSATYYRVADNPFKPGTQDHKDWELENIHIPRTNFYNPDRIAACRTAWQRLSLLKEQVQAKRTWVDSLLEELPGADEPEFPRGSYYQASGGSLGEKGALPALVELPDAPASMSGYRRAGK